MASAVILAAGVGSRLRPLTWSRPKCLVEVAGKPILGWQLDALAKAGVEEIVVVAGYQAETVQEYVNSRRSSLPCPIRVLVNADFESTNNMFSLYMAKDAVAGKPFVLCNGDVVFPDSLIASLLKGGTDLICCQPGQWDEESMKVVQDPKTGYLIDIAKTIGAKEALGDSIDVYSFSNKGSTLFFDHMHEIIDVQKKLKDWTEVAMQQLLKAGKWKARPFDIANAPWMEIDNHEDLLVAWAKFGGFDLTLASKKCVLVNVNGTLLRGDALIAGADSFVTRMRARGNVKLLFYSNNSSHSKAELATQLTALGIACETKDILLSTDGLVSFLKEQRVSSGVHVVGTEGLRATLTDAGIHTRPKERPDFVVVGNDTQLTFDKLRIAAEWMNAGVPLIATHDEFAFPTDKGPIPDAGALINLLEKTTGRKAHRVFGGAMPSLAATAMKDYQAKETVVIGDSLANDWALAKELHVDFILPLCGATAMKDLYGLESHPQGVVATIGAVGPL